jgi:hydrogenase maturation protease
LTKNENSKLAGIPFQILIYGYGNPGRQDDALGIHLVDFIEKWAKEKQFNFITTDQNYQLNIEDADLISHFHLVVFCDASMLDIADVVIEEALPDLKTEFSMHSVTPSFIVGLCQEIFNQHPEAYTLHIKGYAWEFMQEMTSQAQKNLCQAKDVLIRFIEERTACEQQH